MVSSTQLLFLSSSTVFILFGHIVFLVASSSSSSSSNGRCPSSAQAVNVQANRCLENYKAFEDRYQLTGSHLFTIVDVEIIRTLCSDLKITMRCLRYLRDHCSMGTSASHQQQQHQQHQQHHVGQIDAVIRPYLSVVELCDHQHLYEEYAMNQNCLHGQRDMSEQCYRTFHTQTERPKKSTEHVHLQQYCKHLTQLVTCVRSNFALICGESAAMLIEQLVKAAVEGSHRCRDGSTGSHTHLDDHPSTVSPQKSGRVGSLRRSNSAQTIHLKSSICRRIGQLIISVTLSLSSAAFIVNAFRN